MTVLHPVDDLKQYEFDAVAEQAASDLADHGAAFVLLQPGDATRYLITIVRDPRGRYWLASSFGAIYEWSPEMTCHWDYVSSHYLDRPHEWTARVLARFMQTLADKMKEE